MRLPTGQQYGPVGAQVFQQWMAQGRVTPDSLVWCQGWPQWRRADAVFGPAAASGAAPAAVPVAAPAVATPVASPAAPASTSGEAATRRLLQKRRRRVQTMILSSIVLGLAVIALIGVLIYVMQQNQ